MGQTWPAAEPQHIPSKYTVNLKTLLLPLEETAALFFNNATHFEERFVLAGDANTKQAKGATKEPFKQRRGELLYVTEETAHVWTHYVVFR